ncbi:right-handed parallel beta-helix repeat-containing protein [Azospirillum sp. sgz302134]
MTPALRIAALLLLTGSAPAWAGERVLEVNPAAPGAGDGNPGTEAAPLASLGQAVRLALETADEALIRVHPGTYRESVRIHAGKDDEAPRLRIVAVEPGRAVISGAEPLTGWRPHRGPLFRADWPQRMAPATVPPDWPTSLTIAPSVLGRDLLFIGGQRLRPATSVAELTPGSFLVNEEAGVVTMNPPAGLDPRDQPVEVARRDVLLEIGGVRGVEVAGLVVERSAAPLTSGAVVVSDSQDVRLDGLSIRDNNGTGLTIARSSRVTLENTVVTGNGSTGLGAWRIDGLTLRRVTAAANNWRGEAGGFVDWAVAGAKLLQTHNAVIEGFRAERNAAHGLWLDTDIADVRIVDPLLEGNRGPGLTVEAAQGPVAVTGGRIVGNGKGIVAAAAHGVTLERTVVACNAESQILVSGTADQPVTDHRSGAVTTVNNSGWTLTGSLIAADAQGDGPLVATTLTGAPWAGFLASLSSEDNLWTAPRGRGAFRGPWGKSWTFDDWRDRVRDTGSSFELQPDPPCPRALN